MTDHCRELLDLIQVRQPSQNSCFQRLYASLSSKLQPNGTQVYQLLYHILAASDSDN